MSLGKLRRTIGTHSSIHHVAIFPRPTQTGEERLTTGSIVRTTTNLTVSMSLLSILYIGMLPVIKASSQVHTITTCRFTIILSSLTTQQSTDMVLLDIEIVSQGIGPDKRSTIAIALVHLGDTITTLRSKLINWSK